VREIPARLVKNEALRYHRRSGPRNR